MRAITHPRVRNFGGDLLIIYKATNIETNKVYIGQTRNKLKYRIYQHFYDSKRKNRRKDYFHNTIAKYGETAFIFEIIDYASSQEELDEKERYWIKFYKSNQREYGYNEDEGGKSGGTKSSDTKKKIGETTKERWENPEIAAKMKAGLQKGTESWVVQCENNRVLFICPYCGSKQMLPPWVAKNKSACSQQCKAKHGGFKERNEKASSQALITNKERNNKLKKEIKCFILAWCEQNKNIVLNCPSNKITTTLKPLLELIKSQYNIIDIRSLFKCFDVTNRKDFLLYLKNYLNNTTEENIC